MTESPRHKGPLTAPKCRGGNPASFNTWLGALSQQRAGKSVVLTGSASGSLHMWKEYEIECAVTRAQGKPCHTGAITWIGMEESEIITVGHDGFIRIWDSESIESAEVDDGKISVEPMSELRVKPGARLQCMANVPERDGIWFIQDAFGKIWRADLSFSLSSSAPVVVYETHCGPASSLLSRPPLNPEATKGILVSVASDGAVRLNDLDRSCCLGSCVCNSAASAAVWLGEEFRNFCVGFEDGIVRVFFLNPMVQTVADSSNNSGSGDSESQSEDSSSAIDAIDVCLVQALRPHSQKITGLAVLDNEFLVSSSMDGNIFLFSLSSVSGNADIPVHHLTQLGSIDVRRVPLHLTALKLHMVATDENKFQFNLLVGCQKGVVIRLDVPKSVEPIDSCSYELQGVQRTKLQVALDTCHVLYIYVSACEDIIYSVASDNEMTFISKINVFAKEILEHWTWEDFGSSYVSISNYCLLMGSVDGYLRFRIVPDHLEQSSDEIDKWWSSNQGWSTLRRIHDGPVTAAAFAFSAQIFTGGEDMNIFSFHWEEAKLLQPWPCTSLKSLSDVPRVVDIEDTSQPTLKEELQKMESERLNRAAEERKAEVKRSLAKLRKQFKSVVINNEKLPPHVRLGPSEFEFDPRITREIRDRTEQDLKATERQMAWRLEYLRRIREGLEKHFVQPWEWEEFQVNSFDKKIQIKTMPVKFLPDSVSMEFTEIEKQLESTNELVGDDVEGREKVKEEPVDDEVLELMKSQPAKLTRIQTEICVSEDPETQRAIAKYEKKRTERLQRLKEWDALMMEEPPETTAEEKGEACKLLSEEDHIIMMKTIPEYKPDPAKVNALLKKFELLKIRTELHQMVCDFNSRVKKKRDEKKQIVEKCSEIVSQYEALQRTLPLKMAVPSPTIPEMDPAECPEDKWIITDELLEQIEVEMKGDISSFRRSDSSSDKGSIAEILAKRDSLAEDMQQLLKDFDVSLLDLYNEWADLSVALSYGRMRTLLLRDEVENLMTFQDREEELNHVIKEKDVIVKSTRAKLAHISSMICSLEQILACTNEQQTIAAGNFQVITLDTPNFLQFLENIFLSSAEVDESHILESRPKGCPESLLLNVLQLRKKRLELEGYSAKLRKKLACLLETLEEVNRKHESAQKNYGIVKKDIDALQREKFSALNALDDVLVIRLPQINGKEAPWSLDDAVVFPTARLEHLQSTLTTLVEETVEESKRYKENLVCSNSLRKELNEFKSKIGDLKLECDMWMEKKFGMKNVDLETLLSLDFSISVERSVEALEAKRKLVQERKRLEKVEVASLEDRLAILTRENTVKQTTLNVLLGRRTALQALMDSKKKMLAYESAHPIDAEARIEELKRIIHYIEERSAYLEKLKFQVLGLKCKGINPLRFVEMAEANDYES
ncbi:unnamed protein product [Cyprideis torosa]|uniref:Uncharacterized protein n=1 Tax=Cyprideis torosa TaxID=163714 RepID=A0A7R8VZZ0_9CRUS|nr:unnamed protein product [Cyprideis torosa]CAG0879186.1 unnamed protein product [Cyprideis torosa]